MMEAITNIMNFFDTIFINIKGWMLDLIARFLPDWVVILASIVISGVVILCLGPVIMMSLFTITTVGRPEAEKIYGSPYLLAAAFIFIGFILFLIGTNKLSSEDPSIKVRD